MAWVPVPRVPVPRLYTSSADLTLDSGRTAGGVVFRVPKSGDISQVIFGVGVTTWQNIKVGLYTMQSETTPNLSQTYKGSSELTITQQFSGYSAFSLSVSNAAAGDWVAFVVQWAGTAGNISLYGTIACNLPYRISRDSGTWNKVYTFTPTIALVYSDGSIHAVSLPATTRSSYVNFNNASSPNQRGNLFKFPYGVRFSQLDLFQIGSGVDYRISIRAVNSDLSDGGEIAGADYSGSYNAGAVNNPTMVTVPPVEIPANTRFRAVLIPLTSAYVNTFYIVSVGDSSWWKQIGIDQSQFECQMTTRTGSGSWTQTATSIHYILPLITAIDIPSGGGGGFPFPPHLIVT